MEYKWFRAQTANVATGSLPPFCDDTTAGFVDTVFVLSAANARSFMQQPENSSAYAMVRVRMHIALFSKLYLEQGSNSALIRFITIKLFFNTQFKVNNLSMRDSFYFLEMLKNIHCIIRYKITCTDIVFALWFIYEKKIYCHNNLTRHFQIASPKQNPTNSETRPSRCRACGGRKGKSKNFRQLRGAFWWQDCPWFYPTRRGWRSF